MSGERNPEAVGCGASIMKNVWEIRVREHEVKTKLEQERIQRSALPSIDQDWANRVAAKLSGYKRVERKMKPVEVQTDNNVWKSEHSQLPRTLPRGSGPLSRPGGSKGKKGQDKEIKRLQLLLFITQTQPSTLVWGKSWKYNKSLPSPAEGSTDWGQCWMLATQQPCSEAGTPWQSEPNIMDPQNLHFCIKPDYRTLEQQLELDIPGEKWQMSWKKSDPSSTKETSTNGENIPKCGLCRLLLEAEHHDEEWSDSWRSTKSGDQQHPFTAADDGVPNESAGRKQDKNQEISSKWEESWRLANYQSQNKSKHQTSHSPEWADSWRAATVVFSNSKNPNLSLRKDHEGIFDGHSQHRESYFNKIMPVSYEHKDKHLYLHVCKDFKGVSEWSRSWQVTQNNSNPCEEIEKILEASPPKTETSVESQRVESNSKEPFSTSDEADAGFGRLRQVIIHQPKRRFSQSKSYLLKHLEKQLPFMELRDSWKTIKHRMRMERRRMSTNLLHPFRDSEKGDVMKPVPAEWEDSWRFTCQPLYQEPELWLQGWSTTAQNCVNQSKQQSHFVPVDFPKNGGTWEWSLGESWKFSRHQHRPESGQKKGQINQESVTSHSPDKSWAQRRRAASTSDWQAAWMVSDTQFHHDKPSLTQWREAWKWSIDHTHWAESVRREKWVDESVEIQPLKGKTSSQGVKTKMSRSFDIQVFSERCPEKDWSSSWSTASLFDHQPSLYGSSEIIRQSIGNTIQQQHGSKWGRSFRLANPMPQVKQPWLTSPSNQCQYSAMWSREEKIHSNIRNDFDNNPAACSLWRTSHEFLQSGRAEGKRTLKGPCDPRVIITKKAKSRRPLYSNTDKEKQLEKKWAGCHLLGKTQPRPRKGATSVKKVNPEDETNEKFFEEWADSWRFLVRSDHLKNHKSFKSLSGWNESWKFLVPLYQPLNGPKAR